MDPKSMKVIDTDGPLAYAIEQTFKSMEGYGKVSHISIDKKYIYDEYGKIVGDEYSIRGMNIKPIIIQFVYSQEYIEDSSPIRYSKVDKGRKTTIKMYQAK